MPLLELRGLAKRWPGLSVSLDLDLEPGEILALAGPSGCGKSTALRLIAGLAAPDGGSLRIGGRDALGLPPRDRGIGMVFQTHALFPHLSVLGNVCYGLAARGMGKAAREAEARRLLEAMGLAGFEKRRPADLSGGEAQRVALARTLAVKPRVVLLDEPLSSLDEALRRRLRTDIRDSLKSAGLAAVYVTHDLEEAFAVADRVAVMEAGRVLQCGTPRTLWESPAGAAVARFLGNGPCLPIMDIEKLPDTGTVVARTGSGGFPVAAEDSPQNGGFVFFGRSDAMPETSACAQNSTPGGEIDPSFGVFEALCLRADFAGDAVDCSMEAGAERFPLRFPATASPAPGVRARYRVPADRVRILPPESPPRTR